MLHRQLSAAGPRHRSATASRRARRALVTASMVAGTAALIAAAPASGATPPSVEVINRATGTAGADSPNQELLAGVISPDGRTAVYTAGESSEIYGGGSGAYRLYARDVSANTTTRLTTTGRALSTGIDKTGRYVSYEMWDPAVTTEDGNRTDISSYSLWVVDLQTGTKTQVSRASGAAGAAATGARGLIDGNGTAVVFTSTNVPGLGSGLFRRDLTTNVTTRLAADPNANWDTNAVEISSVSDDATRIGLRAQDGTGRIVTATTSTTTVTTPGEAWVSADGTTAAYVDGSVSPAVVRRRALASGTVTSEGVASTDPAQVAWISPDGNQILVAPIQDGSLFGQHPARFLAAPGTAWFDAGPFANGFRSFAPWGTDDYRTDTFSRTVQFAEAPTPGNTISLVNTYGQPLPGSADRPPASVYADVNSLGCASDANQVLNLLPAPGLFESATSITATASAGGQLIGSDTTTAPKAYSLPIAKTIKTLHLDLSVKFADGTTSTGSYDYPIRLQPDC